jgi:hypothetical protein
LGRFNYTTGGADSRVSATLEYQTAELLSGDQSTYQTQAWDPTDGEAVQVMAVETISANSTLELVGRTHTSDTDATSEYEFLAILDFELAGAPPPVTYRERLKMGVGT